MYICVLYVYVAIGDRTYIYIFIWNHFMHMYSDHSPSPPPLPCAYPSPWLGQLLGSPLGPTDWVEGLGGVAGGGGVMGGGWDPFGVVHVLFHIVPLCGHFGLKASVPPSPESGGERGVRAPGSHIHITHVVQTQFASMLA